MNAPAIERGWTVYTEDNKRVGDVVEVHGHYMLVSRGLLVVRDIYVPRYAVASVEDRKVRLSITDERLRRMDWAAPPPPPPLRPDSTAPMIVPSPASSASPDVDTDDGAMGATNTLDMLPASTPEDQTASPFGDVFAPNYDGFDGAVFQPDLDDYEDMGILLGNQVEVDGEAYLTVQQIGSGPAVVFVHGWGFDRRVWDYLTLDLPRDFTMVTYDGRGYGRSSAPWWGYDVARASRDLRVLLRTLDLRDATLVGIDTGAAAALHYIQHGGRRAGRLVLIAPALPPAPPMPPDDAATVSEMTEIARLAEVETTPAEVETTPAEVETTPAEVETTPAEVETTPAEVETDAELTATPPTRVADDILTGDTARDRDMASPNGPQSTDAGTPEDGVGLPDGDEDPVAPYAVEALPEPLRAWEQDLRRDRPLLSAHLAALWAPTASPQTQEWLREGFMSAAPYALLHGLDTLALADYSLSFAGVEAPILVLHGADDPVAPLARVQAALEAAENPKARLVVLDIPGHLPMLTDPERVAAEIRRVTSG